MKLPSQKELAAGAGGVLTWAILLVLDYFWHITIPADIEGVIIVGITALLNNVVPVADKDVLRGINDDIAHAAVILKKISAPSDMANTPASDKTMRLVATNIGK